MSKVNDFILETCAQKYDYKNKHENITNSILYMFNRSLAMFEYNGLPESVPQIQLEKLLQMGGFAIFAKENGNLYAFNGGLGGEPNAYYMPTIATVANPALNLSKNYEIDKDCIVMPNDSLYIGLYPLFSKYCTLLCENEISMLLADVNKRASFLLLAQDDNSADSANDYLKRLFDGEQGVITDKNFVGQMSATNLQGTGSNSLMDLVEYQQYLRASMYNEIGLNSNFNMKRERLNTSEVEMNSGNLYPLIDDMLNSRKKALAKINEMFGTNITVEFASAWTMRVQEFSDSTDAAQDAATSGTESGTDAAQSAATSGTDAAQDAAQASTDGTNTANDDEQKEGSENGTGE